MAHKAGSEVASPRKDESDREAGGTPREVELKLEIDPAGLEALRAHPLVREGLDRAEPPETLHATYFDTPDHDLREAGISLRVRRSGERRVQTLKIAGTKAAGLFDRDEWEAPVDDDTPDLAAVDGSAPLLHEPRIRTALAPLFTVRAERTTLPLAADGLRAEMTLDQGEVVAGERREPLCEVEIELREGTPAALFRIASSLSESVPVKLGIRTKADRGYALTDGAELKVVKGSDPGLRPGMTTAEGFQAIGRTCLRHLLANEPVLLERREPGAVHQMRVAMRRLRAAISLFKPVVEDGERAQVSGELRWAAGSLGAARDLDVYIAKVLAPVREAHPDDPDLAAVTSEMEARREEAYRDALAAIRSDRFRRMTVAVAGWIEAGPWLETDDPDARRLREEPIEDFAADTLARRTRRVRKRGRGLDEMEPEPRHEVRIEVKKLRYAAEFFAPLFEGRKAVKRRKAFLSALERLQESLGDLNDVAVGEGMTGEGQEESGRSRAEALLAGQRSAGAGDALAEALAAYAEVKKAKPFWA